MIISDIIWIAIISVLIISSVLFHIIKIRQWNNKENDYITLIETQQTLLDNKPTLDIKDRVSATKELFSLIDVLIEYEIINNRRFEIFLEKKNKNLDFNNVLEEVGTTVFSSLRSDIYTDKNNLVTKECLMHYIQKRTFVEYFLYLKNINDTSPLE